MRKKTGNHGTYRWGLFSSLFLLFCFVSLAGFFLFRQNGSAVPNSTLGDPLLSEDHGDPVVLPPAPPTRLSLPPVSSSPKAPFKEAEKPFLFSGRVLLRNGFGVGACRLAFRKLDERKKTKSSSKNPPKNKTKKQANPWVRLKTDAQGSFQKRLSPSRWNQGEMVFLKVQDAQDRLIFHAPVALGTGLTILIAARQKFCGHLVTEEGKPIAFSPLSFEIPSKGRPGGAQLVVRLRSDQRGAFCFSRRMDALYFPRFFVLHVFFQGGKGEIVKRVPLSQLKEPGGARIVCSFRKIQVRVVGAKGEGIEGAVVYGFSQAWKKPGHFFATQTKKGGEVQLWFPYSPMEVVVAADGYAPVRKRIQEGKGDLRVMIPLVRGQKFQIRGWVEDPGGNRVAGAFVSAVLWTEGSGAGGAYFLRAQSDAKGRFQLDTYREAFPLQLTLFHPNFGATEWVPIKKPRSGITLHFPTKEGSLSFSLRSYPKGFPFQDGPVSVFLLHQRSKRWEFEEFLSGHIGFFSLPAGPYNFFVLLPGGTLGGQGHCEVLPGKRTWVTLDVVPLANYEGRLILKNASPTGARIQIDDPVWGEHPPPWAKFRVGPSGEFRLSHWDQKGRISVKVYKKQKLLGRARLVAGSGNVLRFSAGR